MNRAERREKNMKFLQKVTDGIMWWIGSIPSLIIHTLVFLVAFLLPILGWVNLDTMLLVLTTILSLEAIYLAIFIQMSVNRSHEHIEDLKEDVTEIQEDIEDIQEDIEEISEDIDEISEDIDDIQEDIEDIAEEEDDDDHSERARNVMLKSNVSSNKNNIKELKEMIQNLQKQLEDLRNEEEGDEVSKTD